MGWLCGCTEGFIERGRRRSAHRQSGRARDRTTDLRASRSGRSCALRRDRPRHPAALSFFGTVSGGVHELDLMVRPDGRALALLAVPFAEFTFDEEGNPTPRGEFWIVDITDPRNPKAVAEWRLYEQGLTIHDASHEITSPFQGNGLFPIMFGHSARAADDGLTAYVAHWDAGVVKVDISDPQSPVTIGHTVYPVGADGDAHSMTPYETDAGRFILQNDEDFEPFQSTAVVTSSATDAKEFNSIQEFWAPTLLADVGPTSGTVHDAGDGCDASDYVGAAGKIALADSVDPFYNPAPCAIGDQVVLAAKAGATVFVSNLLSIDDAYAYGPATDADLSVAQGMPVMQISDIDGLAGEIRAAPGPVTMTLDPSTPGWGFLRVFRETPGENWEEVGRFEGPAVTRTGAQISRPAPGRSTTRKCLATVPIPPGTAQGSSRSTSATPRARRWSGSSFQRALAAMPTL